MKNLLLFGSLVLSLNLFSQNTANPTTTTATYTVSATDESGQTAADNIVVTANSSADIVEIPEDQKLYLYPNPAVEAFEVIHTFNEPIERLVIRDNKGRRVRTYEKPKPEKFFIADIDPGIYSVFVTINGNTYITKLMIP